MNWGRWVLLPCFILLGAVTPLGDEGPPQVIVWNVGQGQWITLRLLGSCHHFDTGGERAPWLLLRRLCGNGANQFHYTHWDWDHISFIRSLSSRLPEACIGTPPAGTPSAAKRQMLERLPTCVARSLSTADLITLKPSIQKPSSFRRARRKPTNNEHSHIFELLGWALIPGDSPIQQERKWRHRLRSPKSIRLLVLGHHGSRTSSSQELLETLPHLKQAIASARKSRYGHPHPRVMDKVKRRRVALVRTEIWGHLRFEVPATQIGVWPPDDFTGATK